MKKFLCGLVAATMLSCTGPDVQLSGEAKQGIQRIIGDNTVERLVCLYGEAQNGRYRVDSVANGTVHSERTSSRGACDETSSYLGSLHNHPSKACRFSDPDKASFYMDDDARLGGVACQTDPLGIVWKTKPKDWYNTSRDTEEITTSYGTY
jgi:hypothetical protein